MYNQCTVYLKLIIKQNAKKKIQLPYDPAIPLLGIYRKETKSLSQKDNCTLTFIAALFAVAKIWKQPKGLPMS